MTEYKENTTEDNVDALHNERLDILEQMALLADEASSIKEQLTRASQKLRATGVAAASDWYLRAVSARRAKLNQIRQFQTKLSKINRQIKVLNTGTKTQEKYDQVPFHAGREEVCLLALAACKEAGELFDILEAVVPPADVRESNDFKSFELCMQRLGDSLDRLEDALEDAQKDARDRTGVAGGRPPC